jgi:hypothetical protein
LSNLGRFSFSGRTLLHVVNIYIYIYIYIYVCRFLCLSYRAGRGVLPGAYKQGTEIHKMGGSGIRGFVPPRPPYIPVHHNLVLILRFFFCRNQVFSRRQLRQMIYELQRFGDQLRLHHQDDENFKTYVRGYVWCEMSRPVVEPILFPVRLVPG